MMTDLEKEEMLHNLENKKTQVVLINNKIYIEDLVDEIRKDNIPKFEPAERMTGIQTKENIDRKKREDPVVKKNKRDISEFRLIDGVEYYRWSIFINPVKDEIMALPVPGRNMSLEARRSYFINDNREYGCKYLHPDQHSAMKEYQIREIVFTKYEPIQKTGPVGDIRSYEDFMDIFHECMAHDNTAKPDIYY